MTFRGPPPAASAPVPTSCWGCFALSPSPSSPCCGGEVQGVLAAESSFAPPSALHTGRLSLSRILQKQSCQEQQADLCSGGSCSPGMKLFSCEPWAALAVLFFTTMLQHSCPAGRALLLRSSFHTLLFLPLLSKYIAH